MPTSPADLKSDQHKPMEKDFDLEKKIQRLSKVQIAYPMFDLNNSLRFWQLSSDLFPKSSPSSIIAEKKRNQ